MNPGRFLLFFCACASGNEHVVKPVEQLLKEAKTLPTEDACKLLTDALASGDYSTQRMQADSLSAMNDEYQVGHARETYCRQVERRAAKLKNIGGEDDLLTLKALALSDGEDEGVRKKAAERLAELVPNTSDKATVDKLTQMEPRGELPSWYLSMRVEELIERRYWELHEDSAVVPMLASLLPLVADLSSARERVTKAALEGEGLEGARADYTKREAALCEALSSIDPKLKPSVLSALLARVPEAELKKRLETFAIKGCEP
jgi:hypothetical protein